jgi:hypothetical protein
MAHQISILGIILLLAAGCKNGVNNDNGGVPVPIFECSESSFTAKGDRSIGLDLLNVSEDHDFDDNLQKANELGLNFLTLHMNWNDIEDPPMNYQNAFNAIGLVSQAAIDNGMKFNLTIRPIDATGKTVPSDLENMRFNNPRMVERFKDLIDYVFSLVEPEVFQNIQIGNEIDNYDTSREHPDFWSDYGEFLFQINQYVDSIDPNVKVGFTATYNGLFEQQPIFTALQNAVDVLGVTYYPIDRGFNVKDPSVISGDLNTLVATYNQKPIYLQELGYQSSSTNNSSIEKQAEFYCNFFQAWDQHSDEIEAVNILRLNDLSQEDAENSALPYGITNISFIEYLRTLGLRTYNSPSQNKMAYEVIGRSLEDRGW